MAKCLFAWVCVCVFVVRRVPQRYKGQLRRRKPILSAKTSIWLGSKAVEWLSRDAQTHCTWLQQTLIRLKTCRRLSPGLSSASSTITFTILDPKHLKCIKMHEYFHSLSYAHADTHTQEEVDGDSSHAAVLYIWFNSFQQLTTGWHTHTPLKCQMSLPQPHEPQCPAPQQ